MSPPNERDFGRVEQSIEHLSSSTNALRLAVDELRDALVGLSDRIAEIETKYRIGRAVVMFVLMLAILAGYGIKDAIDAFIAVAKP